MPTKKQILDLIWNNPVEIGHWVGFNKLGEIHNKWLRDFLFLDEDQTLMAHRGSYKTTDLALFLAIHAIIKPFENVVYFRKTDSDVAELMRTVRNILQSGAFARMVYILYGQELKIPVSNNSEINTSLNTKTQGANQIVGLGIGTSITGKHADIVITDDIVNIKDRISTSERNHTILMYDELQNIKNRGGRFINTGTPWHKEDCFEQRMKKISHLRMYDCYSTGLISDEELRNIRMGMSPSAFSANYELKHIADENAIFTDVKFCESDEMLNGGVAHIDAAYGGEDYTAYTIIKKVTNERYIAFGKIWQKHVDDCLPEIMLLHSKYKAGSISCEKNADKGYLSKELKGLGFVVDDYSERMNKYLKIVTHLKAAWSGIEWVPSTDPEYLSQICDYTENAAHDDAPDSAASLIRKLTEKPKAYFNRSLRGGI